MLKDVVGAKMEPQTPKQIVWAGNKNKLPRILGDVIAQSINEQYGFLYYNGAKYSWYDSRSYKPEAPARIIHGGGPRPSSRNSRSFVAGIFYSLRSTFRR